MVNNVLALRFRQPRLPESRVARTRDQLIEWLRLRAVMLLITAVLGWALIRAVRPMVPAGDGLRAEYFSNPSWEGPPSQSGTDRDQSTSAIWRRWKALPPERFSVRWTGYLTVPRSGSYVFATTSDDGSSLYIDDRIVVDNSGRTLA